jgi:peptidoglycan/LPS O-acetylase OafA/YrhL
VQVTGTTRESDPPRPSTARPKGLPYVPGLDGIRAIAVTAVLLFHGSVGWMRGGYLGVDVFFVLSGFLITSILLAEAEASGRIDLKRFYIGRARRLLPALLLVLVVTALLAMTIAQDAVPQLRQDIIAALTYSTNWWYVVQDLSYFEATGRPPLLQHLWSLAVEEQFYFIWPLLLILIWRRGGRAGVRRWSLGLALASTALMAAWAFALGVPGTTGESRVYYGSDTHAMGLLVGAWLATVWRPGQLPTQLPQQARRRLTGIGIACLGILALAFVFAGPESNLIYRGGLLVIAFATAGVIAVASHPALAFGSWLATPLLRYIGTRSYGIYLWHWPIFTVLRPGIDVAATGFPVFVARIALTLLAAEFSYRYVEMPIRRGAIKRAWDARKNGGRRAVALGTATASLAVGLPVVLLGVGLASTTPQTFEASLGGIEGVGDGPLVPVPSSSASPAASAGADGKAAAKPAVPTVTAVGDSILLGAAPALKKSVPKVVVDAGISRQPKDVFSRIRARKAAKQLGDTVVIHAGTNGIVTAADLTSMLEFLEDRRRVVVINARGSLPWTDDTNQNIKNVSKKFANVVVIDWAGMSQGKRGWFWPDGLHTKETGSQKYAEAIRDAVK